MIFKLTWLNITDNTNVAWLQTFHLYKGSRRTWSPVGYFVKGSARIVEPPRIEYKGFKVKYNKKGDICRSLIIRTYYTLKKKDGGCLNFFSNSGLLIKKKQDLKSKYVFGPGTKLMKRKRLLTAFKTVV
jgi:ribosomal protein L14